MGSLSRNGDCNSLIPLHQQRRPCLNDLITGIPPAVITGIYWHIPFCFHKCHYCDFYSIAGAEDRRQAYVDRWILELQSHYADFKLKPRNIFVGGGTPTLMTVPQWEQMLEALHQHIDLSQLMEWTVEANPETLSLELLKVLKNGGVTRISMGSQSFNPKHLKTLERWHDPQSVIRAAEMIHQSGFEHFNLDHIYAIPGQTLEEYHQDIQQAIKLSPTHLSCYALTYEPNTAMTKKLELGRIEPAHEQLETQMFLDTITLLTEAGYEHYEISNFARPGDQCLHNLMYWKNENWLALGPSASGHLDGLRWKNVPHLGQYLKSTDHGSGYAPLVDVERLPPQQAEGEALMMRIRLIEGIPKVWLTPLLTESREQCIDRFIDSGHLYWDQDYLKLSPTGLLLTDLIASELMVA